ncbi:copper homeostasis protein CutC [Planctomycetota bacterium]|nr:copper homeostasis protein CutC [Planctomycetota bacterium]GDY02754.1 copper homeostasis protein CutC [Planctomycetota bacterium]
MPANTTHPCVEIVVDSVAGALAAQRGGAHRLEVCMGLAEGGLTPSLGLLRAIKAAVDLPVMAMVRPRGGDFLYDASEFSIMRADAESLLAAGADGLVFGVLDATGRVDFARMKELVHAAAGKPVTCHRAFDVTADAAQALEDLIALGVKRVLTSGQQSSALLGAALIQTLVTLARGRIGVLAGGGLRANNVAGFLARTGVSEIHLSASGSRQSAMRFRNPNVPMGCDVPDDEYTLRMTDAAEVTAILAAVRRA